MLRIILKTVREHFEFEKNQPYLSCLYTALFSTAYYGLFRSSELTAGPHAVKVADVHVGENKKKLLFVLRSSKTHNRGVKPQMVKICSYPRMTTRRLTVNFR